MTLNEHAKKIWDANSIFNHGGIPIHLSFDNLPQSQKITLFETAYDELRAKLGELGSERHQKNFHIVDSSVADLVNRMASANETMARKVQDLRDALRKIADGIGYEIITLPGDVADMAVAAFNCWKRAEAELERLRLALPAGAKGASAVIVEAALAELARLREMITQSQPAPPKKAAYEWRGDLLFREGVRVGETLLATRQPGPVWYWSVEFADRSRIEGQSNKSETLARAAVESIVRAHFGDEA